MGGVKCREGEIGMVFQRKGTKRKLVLQSTREHLKAPGILCGDRREACAVHGGSLKLEFIVNRENALDKKKAPGFKNLLGNVGEGGACCAPALGDDVTAKRKPALDARNPSSPLFNNPMESSVGIPQPGD